MKVEHRAFILRKTKGRGKYNGYVCLSKNFLGSAVYNIGNCVLPFSHHDFISFHSERHQQTKTSVDNFRCAVGANQISLVALNCPFTRTFKTEFS